MYSRSTKDRPLSVIVIRPKRESKRATGEIAMPHLAPGPAGSSRQA